MFRFSLILMIAIFCASGLYGPSAEAGIRNENALSQVRKINFHGFHKCKEMGSQGYKATVDADSTDHDGWGSNALYRFRVNTCFETQAQCQQFLNNIHHHVDNILTIYQRKCYERG